MSVTEQHTLSRERAFHRFGNWLIAVAIGANPWVLGRMLTLSGRIESHATFLFVSCVDLAVLIAGVVMVRQCRALTLRKFVITVLAVVISIGIIEGGLYAIQLMLRQGYTDGFERRKALSIYKDQPWAPQLFSEAAQLKFEYSPLLGWKSVELHGTYMNTDAHGLRATTNPALLPGTGVDTVFVFGGSTVWGAIVRDAHTIPSELSTALNGNGHPSFVLNYGENAYTFTQNLVRLQLRLQKGERPATVVCYEGVNDVLSAYYAHRTGATLLDDELRSLMEWRQQSAVKRMGSVVKEFLKKRSMIYQSFQKLSYLLYKELPGYNAPQSYTDEDLRLLARAVADDVKANVKLLDALSAEYRFRYLVCLQPVIYTKATLTEEEKNVDPRVKDQRLAQLYIETYRMIVSDSLHYTLDLSGALNQMPGTCYSDYCHVSEEANGLIAHEIASAMTTISR